MKSLKEKQQEIKNEIQTEVLALIKDKLNKKNSYTYQYIGELFGYSRQRIFQVAKRFFPENFPKENV